ncbi:hypothetical protein EUX98_g8589 [Antrodiella citrinella]|uniref:Zn(2)-C6 fungal-type domain-containing protein n=1 Tax=Antrodiella citrinella TaxID=2447956 RepID=A0A4S4M5G2_9APHY|nr:hypothetical protein EUX98_g8589 [Antrodiella citrinella]
MSLSPSTSNDAYEQPSGKRRRTSFSANTSYHSGNGQMMSSPQDQGPSQTSPAPTSQSHIPKRGARACTACRKGKNRCEGEAPCRRCQLSGTPCVFEKPEKKNVQAMSNASVERLSRLEGQYLVMQSQMIGMQSSLDRILSAVQQNQAASMAPSAMYGNGSHVYTPPATGDGPSSRPRFPPLPGFAPPPHKYATYGIIPSTAPSSDDESEDTLPRSTLNAPIEALQGLANAAAEAAAAPSNNAPRVKKRKKAEPTPHNAFPHVVEKGLVSDSEARELFHIFFSGCHIFIPVFDPTYDTYESIYDRTPWTFDAILAVASKIRSGTGPLSPSFYKSLEEAQGIARSSLFGPVVRKEAVQGMLLLAAWSTNGWLPSGHAMRMALDLGLHRALEKLADEGGKHRMSLGTGRPIVLRDESSIRHCRLLLSHSMASPTDVRLISQVELIAQKTQIYETLSPLNGQVNHNTLAFIRRANIALDKWWADCDELHRQSMDDEALPRKILAGELHYAKLWLVCVALRGVSWDKMPFEQRELAFQAKDAASNCISNLLNSPTYRAALRYAVHDSLVTAAFSGLFLLKMANLFPAELDLNQIIVQVEQLAQLLSDVAAERYALTLRIMLANLRRKMGFGTPGGATPITGGGENAMMPPPPPFLDPNLVNAGPSVQQQPLTLEELGMPWPSDRGAGIFSPSAIPLWLQEQVCRVM